VGIFTISIQVDHALVDDGLCERYLPGIIKVEVKVRTEVERSGEGQRFCGRTTGDELQLDLGSR